MDDYISISELTALKDCGKRKYDIMKLSLRSKDFNKNMLNKTCFTKISELIAEKKFSTEVIKDFVNKTVERAWYELDIQYSATIERTVTLITRLGEYTSTYIKDDDVLVVNHFYQTSFPARYKQVQFNGVSGTIHLIIDRGDYIEAVLFESGIPPYSEKARKEQNLPKNNINSAIIYSALCDMYPQKPIKVSFFYLKSKDDKGTTYVGYENKAGKNVVSVDYAIGTSVPVEIKRILSFNCDQDCDNCLNASMCKMDTSVRVPEIQIVDNSSQLTVTPSPSQDEVIHHINGPMLVEAVPGAGKTFALVHRLAYLIKCGIKPEQILMITFTNKAAAEIESRVSALVGDNMPNIETFNSFGYSLLRANPGLLGGNVKLAAPVDKKSMIMQSIKDCAAEGVYIQNISYSQMLGNYGLVETVFKWFSKIDSIGAEAFAKDYKNKDIENIFKIYTKYQQIFIGNGFIDYDDQIGLVNKLFSEHPEVAHMYHNMYKYIMVDEFQDTNEAQFNMVYSLAGSDGNIVAVGDVDQGIYGFRGGSPRYSLEFSNYFKCATTVMMADNYRCTSSIIESANTLIHNNPNRFDKRIIAHKDGSPVILYEGLVGEQTAMLVDNLKNKYKAGEIAVIARRNSLLKKFAERAGLDNTSAKDYIIDDTIFLGLLDVMELFYNGLSSDDVVLYRALQYAGADKHIVRANSKKSLYEDLIAQNLIPDIKASYENLFMNGNRLHDAAVRISECFKILALIPDELTTDDISGIINNLTTALFCIAGHPVTNALANMAFERAITDIHSVYELMKKMSIFGDTKRVGYPVDSGHINLLTAHDSKGKEFKCVILYGVDEFEPDEEERRLLYVALTRAKETLIIVKNAESENMLPEFQDTVKRLVMPRRDVVNG